jgi:hypothetical protein
LRRLALRRQLVVLANSVAILLLLSTLLLVLEDCHLLSLLVLLFDAFLFLFVLIVLVVIPVVVLLLFNAFTLQQINEMQSVTANCILGSTSSCLYYFFIFKDFINFK